MPNFWSSLLSAFPLRWLEQLVCILTERTTRNESRSFRRQATLSTCSCCQSSNCSEMEKNKYTPTINRWLIKIWGALSIQKLSTLKRHLHNKCLDMLSPFIDYLNMWPLAQHLNCLFLYCWLYAEVLEYMYTKYLTFLIECIKHTQLRQ